MNMTTSTYKSFETLQSLNCPLSFPCLKVWQILNLQTPTVDSYETQSNL